MTTAQAYPDCPEPRCIGGWLYNGIGGMVFPANERCKTCSKPERYTTMEIAAMPKTNEIATSGTLVENTDDGLTASMVSAYNATRGLKRAYKAAGAATQARIEAEKELEAARRVENSAQEALARAVQRLAGVE